MINQNPKPYFNQVAMIESQYESKRRNLTGSNNSSLLQNKSPLRQRQNTNSINTPSRLQPMLPNTSMISNVNCSNNGGISKVSLSPIRSRRNEGQMSNNRITAVSRRKAVQNYCENHSSKLAKFMIDKDNEYFYFCERCAIPLISNGFKLTKILQQQQNQAENNPRIKQINQFLKQLQTLESNLSKKKQSISQILTHGQTQLQSQLEKIQQYYMQFYEIIDEHKRRVIEQMKAQYQKSSRSVNISKQKIDQAIKDSKNMKEDIYSSKDSVILEAMQNDYRSVMNQYYDNLEGFKEICNLKNQESIKVRTLSFNNGQSVCQSLIEGLVIEWNDEQSQPEQVYQNPNLNLNLNLKSEKSNRTEYQQRGKSISRGRQEQQSDRQNPIECLETQQRKSSPKQMGGLFCSFDE